MYLSLCITSSTRFNISTSELYNFVILFRFLETRDISEVETALANLVGRLVETPSDGGWFWGRNPIVQSKARAQLTNLRLHGSDLMFLIFAPVSCIQPRC